MTSTDQTRRPIGARSAGWAKAAARFLTNKNITPNRISALSMVFAGLAAVSLVVASWGGGLFLLIAAVMVIARLLANMFDGMVAVEGGRGDATGPFWNEVPDRISDTLILTAAGGLAGHWWLGLLASVLAVMTAYVREVGHRLGQPADFSGPFAKQQRMAAIIGACILGFFLGGKLTPSIFTIVLGLTCALTAWTVVKRSSTVLNRLQASA
ncbi:MAG: CDP-alcohol phosphatidyltransferase family protein [Parvularculaceae bacterium]|nr:CDP-alcohol phosphatidyltransferase family protein [Parvularculaceae bacterium]